MQTQLLTSLKPLSIHTHNRNGPPNGGLFLFLFFCPRGDADMPLLPPSPDPIEGPGGEEGAPEQGGGPPPGRDMLGEVTGVGRGLYGRGDQIAGGLLEGMLREMRELRRLTEGYYTRPRDGTYTAAFWYAPRRDSLE